MKTILTVLATAAIALPLSSFAAGKDKSVSDRVSGRAKEVQEDLDTYNKGVYGMAGCGLGSIVFKEDGGVQILAATTNGSTYTQFFGITSGTSNCTGRAKNTAAEQEVFIRNNYAQLSTQAAQGEGEHMNAFAELLGCEREELLRFSQENRDRIFATDDPQQVLGVLKDGMKSQCKRLG